MKTRSPLAVLFLTVLVDLIGFGIVLPLLPRYADRFAAAGWAIGALQGSFSLMQLVFMPFWGRLSDRIGRRPVLMIGLAGSVASYALFGIADSFAVLLASRIAAGIFGATIGTAQAYIADVTDEKGRGRGMAVIGAAFGVGFAVGPIIGGLSYDQLGSSAPGFIAAGLSAVALLVAWFFLPEPDRRLSTARRGIFGGEGIRHAFSTPTLPLILLLQFIATFAFSNFEGTLSILTKVRWEYTEADNGWLFSYIGVCLLVIQGGLVRRLLPRFGELNFVVGGCAVLMVGLAALGLADTAVQALVVVPVAILGFSMLTPSLSSLLSRRTPQSLQGEVLGIGQSMLALARALGPAIGMPLMGLQHPTPKETTLLHPSWPYWFGAAAMFVALIGGIRLRSAKVPERADAAAV